MSDALYPDTAPYPTLPGAAAMQPAMQEPPVRSAAPLLSALPSPSPGVTTG